MARSEKILSIQYLRGLAALAVVFCHFGMILTNYPKLSAALSSGQLGVLVFFFISGFVIVYSLEKSGYKPDQFFTFLIKRSIRIDPPYWAVIILYIALGSFLNYFPSSERASFQFSTGQLIAHLFYAVPFTHYAFYCHIFWTLCIEFQFYILIGLLYFLSDNKAYKTIFLIAFAVLNLLHINGDALIFNNCAIFALGISFMAFYQNRSWRNAILPILFLCLTAFSIRMFAAILLSITCVVVMLPIKKIKALNFLGNISYSLYLTHIFIGTLCYYTFRYFAISQYQAACFGIQLVVAILFAWLFYCLVEKPSILLSKKFIYQRTSRISLGSSPAKLH